jgi:hypothetical protein
MELGSNFSAKLEPFLLMGKTMKGAAAAKLIQDATAAPGVFVFSELLELSSIQEVSANLIYTSPVRLMDLSRLCDSWENLKNMSSFYHSFNYSHIRHTGIISVSFAVPPQHIMAYRVIRAPGPASTSKSGTDSETEAAFDSDTCGRTTGP